MTGPGCGLCVKFHVAGPDGHKVGSAFNNSANAMQRARKHSKRGGTWTVRRVRGSEQTHVATYADGEKIG
jgi:hypothetical protein